MVATQLNMPLDFLQKLWSASKLNSGFVLSFRGKDKSLAQIALENNNPELLDFWLSQDSASVIEPFKSTLLDMLTPAINDAEKTIKTELFQILMRYNVTVNNTKTQYKLGSWLDEDIYSQYLVDTEKNNFMSIDISNRLQVGNAVTDI